jgi:organic radical activating enzyme
VQRKDRALSEQTLRVAESFVSVQGEGYFSGTRALFVRLAGCNAVAEGLDCAAWCDSRTAWDPRGATAPAATVSLTELDVLVREALAAERPELLVFTGGEPLLQRTALEIWLRESDAWRSFARVCFETNGTVPRDLEPREKRLWFTVSPKGPHYDVGRGPVDEVKVVITPAMAKDVAGMVSLLRRLADHGRHHFVQPQDNDPQLAAWAATTILRECPGWRVSLQLHKWLGVK